MTTISSEKKPSWKRAAQAKKRTLTSITRAFYALTILGVFVLTIVTLVQVDRFLQNELHFRIRDLVNVMAINIDGDMHRQIRTIDDSKTAEYLKLKNNLQEMRQRGTEIANAYTMRKMDDGTIVFVVDGSAKDQNEIGDVYPNKSVTETLLNAFNATPQTHEVYIEPQIDKDDWGVWLSAYAPIFDSSGKLDGILGIDVSAQSIQTHQFESIVIISVTSFIVVIITLPFVFRLMNFIKVMTTELEQVNFELKRQQYALNQHAIVSIADKTGRIVYINDKFAQISGYLAHELIGQDHRLLNSGVHPKEFFMTMWETIRNGKVWHSDICNRAKDGHLYWVQSTIVPFLDANGKIESYISMRTDISAQKEMEQAAVKSEEWQRTVLNNLGDGVYLLNLNGQLTYLNETGERLFGYKFAELKDKKVHDILHHHRPDGSFLSSQACPILLNMHKQIEYKSDDELFFRKDGTCFSASVSSTPLFESSKLVGVVVCFRDISEQRIIQLQLIEAKNAAEQATKVKSEFLSTMSHEIRTPMNGIIGMTDLLLDTPLDAEQLEFTTIIKNSSNALLGIINDILDFSKIEAGQFELENIGFSFNDVIDGSNDVIAPRAHEKSLSLISYVDPKIPEHLLGDPMRLRQIVLNFLSNAIKFTDEGTVLIRAILKQRVGKKCWVRIEITDNGIGISEEAQQRLFQPFSQADSSTTRKYGGTGLGLSICKRLIELMHGRIGVESELGHGSTFWMEVPFKLANNVDEQAITRNKLKNKLVLVLGYNEGHHEIYVSYLNEWGVDIHSCDNILETHALLEQVKDNEKSYDAILLAGLVFDELLNVVQLLRAEKAFAQVPIIVCQPSRESEVRHKLLNAGATQILITPVKQSTLFDSLIETFYHETHTHVATKTILTHFAANAGEKHRVLLVEDNAVNQRIAVRLLEKMGLDVDIANNGQEAFDVLTTNHDYALVLMDCQMPIMDGFVATRLIRHHELNHNFIPVPIVAMTANAMQGDRERCLDAGMDDYISKPIEIGKLQQTLKKWLLDTYDSVDEVQTNDTEIAAIQNTSPAIDINRMLNLFDGDKEIIDELFDVFYESIDPLKEKLTNAVKTKSETITEIIHNIKGSSANIGAEVLRELCEKAERVVATKNWTEIEEFAIQIEQELNRVKVFIENNK
ncbi:MAG: ATP-binding protein [Methylococcales bacterium]|nr:ATP-binding protein [Methylococcales bacterium]